MFWQTKKQPPPAVAQQKPHRGGSPDEIVAEMLAAYRAYYFDQAINTPSPDTEAAKWKIERARKIIADSGVGYSVCTLLEHVRHWPAWLQRDDFKNWVWFPAENISGSFDKTEQGHTKTKVDFTYSGVGYSLVWIDEGISKWNDEDRPACWTGTVELSSTGEVVVGLDIERDISDGDERWHFYNVFAFAPGEWMSHVSQIGALIDAGRARSPLEVSLVRRAAKINL